VSAAARAAVDRVAATRTLLVALDFDGTLAPTVDDPDTAAVLPGSRAAIESLAALPCTLVALVSGRHLEGLARVSRMPEAVLLVGSHGAESLIDGVAVTPELDEDERRLLARLVGIVEGIAARFPGARAEPKPSGCGLHTRQSSAADARAAREEALREVAALESAAAREGGGITERYGKDILEFTVRTADKGTAITALRERTAASAVLFVGDDVTDEDGFRVLEPQDAGVLVAHSEVGRAGDPDDPGASAAEFRVDSPEEVAGLLALLAESRERAVRVAR
jgi:trehalose 6-phosphate phosphatase